MYVPLWADGDMSLVPVKLTRPYFISFCSFQTRTYRHSTRSRVSGDLFVIRVKQQMILMFNSDVAGRIFFFLSNSVL